MNTITLIMSAITFGVFIGLFISLLASYIIHYLSARKVNRDKQYWLDKIQEEKNKSKEVKYARETEYEQKRRRRGLTKSARGCNQETKGSPEQGRSESNASGQWGIQLPGSDFTLRD